MPLDLLPLPIQVRVYMEAWKKADVVRKIHAKTKEALEKKDSCNPICLVNLSARAIPCWAIALLTM
jgi:hypothetical protein